jgi:SAM-dependent methyltransferase
MSTPKADDRPGALERELSYYERLYAGFAQSHFARPAVRALRQHMVDRMVRVLSLNSASMVLSLGCGVGDTELLLAPRVGRVVGIDLSPSGVRQANADAARLGIGNAEFVEGAFQEIRDLPPADAVIAIFFLHHLPDAVLAETPARLAQMLKPGGMFYSLDPSRHRLSGKVGRLLIPGLMKRYQTEDEQELDPGWTEELFQKAGFDARSDLYDFASSPLAGVFPGWRFGYRATRAMDDGILRIPGLRNLGSNFEIIAQRCARR